MDGESDAPPNWLSDIDATAGWQRYHLIRDILRDGRPSCLSTGFSARVMQALEHEPVLFNPRLRNKPFNSPVLKPLAGLAIAATVAAVTVMGIQNFYNPGASAPATLASGGSPAPSPLAAGNTTPAANTPARLASGGGIEISRAAISQHTLVSATSEPLPGSEEETADENLNSYLFEHVELSSGGHMRGMLPYVRLAGYDNTR